MPSISIRSVASTRDDAHDGKNNNNFRLRKRRDGGGRDDIIIGFEVKTILLDIQEHVLCNGNVKAYFPLSHTRQSYVPQKHRVFLSFST